jgi:hypothetical protein
MNREMNQDGSESIDPSGIRAPGSHEECRNQTMANPLQLQVQQTEQKAGSGFFRSRITAHDPAHGEAG